MGYGIFGSGYVTKYGVPVIDCVGIIKSVETKASKPVKAKTNAKSTKKPRTLSKFIKEVAFIARNKFNGTFNVYMKNGDIISAKLSDGDTWDDEKALLVCFAKYIGGGNLRDLFGLLDGVIDTRYF